MHARDQFLEHTRRLDVTAGSTVERGDASARSADLRQHQQVNLGRTTAESFANGREVLPREQFVENDQLITAASMLDDLSLGLIPSIVLVGHARIIPDRNERRRYGLVAIRFTRGLITLRHPRGWR